MKGGSSISPISKSIVKYIESKSNSTVIHSRIKQVDKDSSIEESHEINKHEWNHSTEDKKQNLFWGLDSNEDQNNTQIDGVNWKGHETTALNSFMNTEGLQIMHLNTIQIKRKK